MAEFGMNMKIVPAFTFISAFANVPHHIQEKTEKKIEEMRRSLSLKGLNFEPIRGKEKYSSVRVDDDYRMILLVKEDFCFLLWVDKHDDAYDWAERHSVSFDPQGMRVAIEYVPPKPTAPEKPDGSKRKPPKEFHMLFAPLGREKLAALGVPDDVMKDVLGVQDVGRLQELQGRLSIPTYEALDFLAQNESYEDVLEYYRMAVDGTPANGSGSNDPDDWDMSKFAEALKSAASRAQFYVPETESELRAALDSPLDQWRYFLHPTQRKYAEKSYRGPVRVLGSAGTGKTVVAMHRAKFLAEKVFTGPDDRILVTTFTSNLAKDVEEQLKKICTPESMARIDVENISSWAFRFIRKRDPRYAIDYDGTKREQFWNQALERRVADSFSNRFYKDEYALIIQPQNITTLAEYKRASRVGRGKPLGRKDKEAAWPVFEEFLALVAENNLKDYDDLYADVAAVLDKDSNGARSYRAVVVDEAQDLSLNALKMLRKIVPEGENDLFLVGDARQRIYGYKSSLSAAGINIRGRGQKLRVNYRTTAETYRFASSIMSDDYDDLDGGTDAHNACVSLRTGSKPRVGVFKDAAAEKRAVEEILNRIVEKAEGKESALNSVCVVARTNEIRDEFAAYFNGLNVGKYQIRAIVLDKGNVDDRNGLRVASIHRVKGLEFDDVIVVSANDGVIPLRTLLDGCDQDDPIAKELAEKKERSLLYVALTRARRTAYVTAYGKPSPFVEEAKDRCEILS